MFLTLSDNLIDFQMIYPWLSFIDVLGSAIKYILHLHWTQEVHSMLPKCGGVCVCVGVCVSHLSSSCPLLGEGNKIKSVKLITFMVKRPCTWENRKWSEEKSPRDL